MLRFIISLLIIISFSNFTYSDETNYNTDNLFHVGQMNSYDKNFSLYFKTREKSVIARGENFNYVTDFPQDLYIYDHELKKSSPLISYEWFPSHIKFFLNEYNFPVFPEDFAYYLLKDNNTLVMISAVKNFNKNFKFDIANKKLDLYPSDGKFEFIISSIAKKCGHSNLNENYKCTFYKPLISNNLIN